MEVDIHDDYDDLIEQVYRRRGKPLGVFSSNFDFGNVARSTETRLYKIHGTMWSATFGSVVIRLYRWVKLQVQFVQCSLTSRRTASV